MNKIAENAVKYNPHERVWETWDDSQPYEYALLIGGVVAFPAGIEGKRAALLAALRNTDPITYVFTMEAIKAHPTDGSYIDRAIKAGYLVLNDKVRPVLNRRGRNQFIAAYVDSCSREGVEYVVRHQADFVCNCESFRFRKSADFRCCHILAVLVRARVDRHYFNEAIEQQVDAVLAWPCWSEPDL